MGVRNRMSLCKEMSLAVKLTKGELLMLNLDFFYLMASRIAEEISKVYPTSV